MEFLEKIMGHFAKVVDGVVTKVIAAEPDYFEEFVDSGPGKWVQTSYNTRGGVHYSPNSNDPDSGEALRKNYAGIGHLYDSGLDAFYKPQPYPSWNLNESTCYWEPPTPYPSDGDSQGSQYGWNESTKAWDEVA